MSMTMQQVEVFTGGPPRRRGVPTLVDHADGLGFRDMTTLVVPSWAPFVISGLAIFGGLSAISWVLKNMRGSGGMA